MKHRIQKLIAANELDQARQLLVSSCTESPNDSELWLLLGAVYGRMGDFSECINCSRKSISLAPDNLDAYTNLAAALVSTGKFNSAIEPYAEIVRLQPTNPQALNNLGSAYATAEKFQKATHYFRKALVLQPDYIEAQMNLAAAYRRSQNLDLAIQTYQGIVNKYPDQLQPSYQLANTLVENGDMEAAIVLYKSVIQNHPGFRKAIAGLADAYEKFDLHSEAFNLVNEAIESGDRAPQLVLVFGKLAKRYKKTKRAIELINQTQQSSTHRSLYPKLQYQLAKLYESETDYPNAFKQYTLANQNQGYSYDAGKHTKLIDTTTRIFSSEFFASANKASNQSQQPVFIVGMPRSGTSLTEQILASHPLVSGAGELPTITEQALSLPKLLNTTQTYPECVINLDQKTIDSISDIYLRVINSLFPGAERVTDKMPHNFLYLGLIYLMFPKAKFIHCKRNAADTCLSIYCNHMTAAHGYSTSLENIGAHYSEYRRLMEHWSNTLPERIYDISYEELLSDPELQIRNLLEFCELPWDSQCLEFHKSSRYVKTLSYAQVRNPLHTNSVDRWKIYEKFLAPLFNVLPADDYNPASNILGVSNTDKSCS